MRSLEPVNIRTNERTYVRTVLTYIRTGQTLYPLHNFVVRGDNNDKIPTEYINSIQRISPGLRLQIIFVSGEFLCELELKVSILYGSFQILNIKSVFFSHNRLTNG